MALPTEVQALLDEASRPRRTAFAQPRFTCRIFNSPWDQFVELWAPRAYAFLGQALGPFATEPAPEIISLEVGAHSAGANASFSPDTGQVRLCTYLENQPGLTLEKLLHEFTHANLNNFPEGDPFYEEGYVDFSVWVMAHAPVWQPYRDDMIRAAAYNIEVRRERGLQDQNDYDRKRWAGGLFASLTKGPFIISNLRNRKMEGNFSW